MYWVLSTSVREDSWAMRLGTRRRPACIIGSSPTISRENYIYFRWEFPGNHRKPGNFLAVLMLKILTQIWLAPGFLRFPGKFYVKYMQFSQGNCWVGLDYVTRAPAGPGAHSSGIFSYTQLYHVKNVLKLDYWVYKPCYKQTVMWLDSGVELHGPCFH